MKIIIDLCGGTGAWSRPYKKAGYDVRLVTLPDQDVRSYHPPMNVYGILAAPPCTMFSMVRTTPKRPRDLKEGMEIVIACLQIIWSCQYDGKLAFWAMENPRGYLRRFLGFPPFSFDPSEYGANHNKFTDLWGKFNMPSKLNPKKKCKSIAISNDPFEKIPEGYKLPGVRKDAIARSITPQGFAKAFFEANQ